MNSEAFLLLSTVLSKMKGGDDRGMDDDDDDGDVHAKNLRKTLDYLAKFSAFKDATAVREARKYVSPLPILTTTPTPLI